MAYATYTTDALVCGTYDRNTADRSYRLFTREAGMLFADARSVRLEKSRQRYGLTDFSVVRVSLVRGKAGWKIGSIVPGVNFYHAAKSQAARGYVRDLVREVRRYVQGEEPAPRLYDFVVVALGELASVSDPAPFLYDTIVLQVLLQLGYVSPSKVPEALATADPKTYAPAYSESLHRNVRSLIMHAETASQL